ncbi:MAG: tetracycline resistance MFS efflux pump [Azospira oryzae]|nr:MAG: tetracycline resistance MFS efflux pump [Azospira oryzae]
MSEKRNPALIFIFITLLIDITGIGIIAPVAPQLIESLTHASTSKASLYAGALGAVYSIMQFFFAPIIGGLSDQYGRRPVLLASLFGFGLDYILVAFAPDITWLFIGRILAGILGASFTTAAAYIADVSTPETRAQNFGIIGAAFGMGFILGPVIGGLLGSYGVRAPFLAAAALTLINWLYGFFVLPESLKLENRRKFEWKRANAFGTFKSLSRFPVIAGLLVALSFFYLASHAVQSNWSFFTEEKFNWDSKQIGISLGVVGLTFGIVQGVLIRKIIPWLGQEKSVYVGLGMSALGFFLFAFASQSWMMYAFTAVYSLGGIAGPALQGVISNTVAANEQGELQGGLTSLVSLAAIVGPLVMSGTFYLFTENYIDGVYFPGAAMLLGAVLAIVSTLLARRTLKKSLLKA